MLEKKSTDLLNQELDGTNSDKERAVVKKLLARNPEAKRYFEELQSLKALFRQVRAVDPPPYLRNRILNSLPVRRTRRAPVSSQPLLQMFWMNARYRTLSAFVGGAVAGILLFAIFSSSPEPEGAVGTIAGETKGVVTAQASLIIEAARASGTLSARQAGPLLTADLRLQADEPVEVSILFDRTMLRFDAFRQEQESRSTVAVLEGELRIAHTGVNTYGLTFLAGTDEQPVLTVRLHRNDTLISEQELVLESTNH